MIYVWMCVGIWFVGEVCGVGLYGGLMLLFCYDWIMYNMVMSILLFVLLDCDFLILEFWWFLFCDN